MKRILILLLSLTLCLGGLTACGNDDRNDTGNPGSSVTDGGTSGRDDGVLDGDAGAPDGSTGGDVNGNGSGSMPDGALNNGTVGENPAASRDDAGSGDGAASSGRAAHSSARTADDETLFRAASYRQMLRNARVHDGDGILTDGENALTPGILH